MPVIIPCLGVAIVATLFLLNIIPILMMIYMRVTLEKMDGNLNLFESVND